MLIFVPGAIIIIFMQYSGERTRPGWHIAHEEYGGYFLRIESWVVTEDFVGRHIIFQSTHQHTDVYIGDKHILSSRDFGYVNPTPAMYVIEIMPKYVGQTLRIVFSTTNRRENLLISDVSIIGSSNHWLDYSIIPTSIITGALAFIVATVWRQRNKDNIVLYLYVLANFTFALRVIRAVDMVNILLFTPRMLYVLRNIMFFGYMLPMLAIFYLLIKESWKKYAFILSMLTVFYIFAAFVLNTTRIIPARLLHTGFNYVIVFSFASLGFMLLLQNSGKNFTSVLGRVIIILWTMWGATILLRLLVFDMNVATNIELRLIYSVSLMTATLFGIINYAKQMSELELNKRVNEIKIESLLQKQAHEHEIRAIKHDSKSHLSAVRILLESNQMKRAVHYLKKHGAEVVKITDKVYHEHDLINWLIYDLKHRAKRIGVIVHVDLQASPKNIDDSDIITLLSNIINNAIEACDRLPKGQERVIRLSIRRNSPFLVFVCENSALMDININTEPIGITHHFKRRTSKKEVGHGYGLNNIQKIAKLYDGKVRTQYSAGEFKISVLLMDEA